MAAPVTEQRVSRVRRVTAPGLSVAALGAATIALALRDPHVPGSWGLCPSQAIGFDCPGCGGLRAVNDLTQGRFLDAASSNVFLVATMPLAIFLLGRWVHDAWRGIRRGTSPLTVPLVVVGLAALVLFTVLRNLPGLEWLAS